MNRALLRQLQGHTADPCITLLHTTTVGARLHAQDVAALERLAAEAAERLTGTVTDDVRSALVARLHELIDASIDEPATPAIAVCVSLDLSTVVRLGRTVRSRCVVDRTFATREMVADANRTAVFRVVTVSDRLVRVLLGDRARLAEDHDDRWPIVRDDDQSLSQWVRVVSHALRVEHDAFPLPTVVAGVERSVRELLKVERLAPVGIVPGNHDRTGWADLHAAAWPLVEAWLQTDRTTAMDRLDRARSTHRFAGGIDEVWELAHDGRVQLLVVEEDYERPARVREGRLVEAHDEGPDVMDDAVDELIEVVARMGGNTIVVPSGDLADHGRLAAVLRY